MVSRLEVMRDDDRQHGPMCDKALRRPDWCPCGQTENILAIEAEAADRLRAENERLTRHVADLREALTEVMQDAVDWDLPSITRAINVLASTEGSGECG